MAHGSKPLIVIVEDEKELANLIAEQLEDAGMMTQVFHRAANAHRFFKDNFANLMLLDVSLPDETGFDLLEELNKEDIIVPTIFLTASNSEAHKVRGLDMGGDDYVTKPFSFPELISRIRAVLRRAETAHDKKITPGTRLDEEPFQFCNATVNPTRMEVTFPNGEKQKIGKKELGILSCLVSQPDVVVTRKSLIHSVWGIHADVRSRSLDQYIVKIREAFSQNDGDLSRFRTIHGVGYLYETENSEEEAAAAD